MDRRLAQPPLQSFPYRRRFFAFASAEIIELGATSAAFLLNFHFGDAGRMQRKYPFDTFSVGNTANGKGFVQTTALSPDHNSSKDLNALFVAFHHPGVHSYAVTNGKFCFSGLLLLLFNRVDDTVHKMQDLERSPDPASI